LKGGKKPTGGNAMGDQCIKAAYKTLGLPPPAGLKRIVRGGSEDVELQYSPENDIDESTLRAYAAALERRQAMTASALEKRLAKPSPDLEPRAACAKNTLVRRPSLPIRARGEVLADCLTDVWPRNDRDRHIRRPEVRRPDQQAGGALSANQHRPQRVQSGRHGCAHLRRLGRPKGEALDQGMLCLSYPSKNPWGLCMRRSTEPFC
jgi:hypothetical protein